MPKDELLHARCPYPEAVTRRYVDVLPSIIILLLPLAYSIDEWSTIIGFVSLSLSSSEIHLHVSNILLHSDTCSVNVLQVSGMSS